MIILEQTCFMALSTSAWVSESGLICLLCKSALLLFPWFSSWDNFLCLTPKVLWTLSVAAVSPITESLFPILDMPGEDNSPMDWLGESELGEFWNWCEGLLSGEMRSFVISYPTLYSLAFHCRYGRKASFRFPIICRVIKIAASCCNRKELKIKLL